MLYRSPAGSRAKRRLRSMGGKQNPTLVWLVADRSSARARLADGIEALPLGHRRLFPLSAHCTMNRLDSVHLRTVGTEMGTSVRPLGS